MCNRIDCANLVQTKLAPDSVQICANVSRQIMRLYLRLVWPWHVRLHLTGGAWRRHGEGFATVKKHICPTPIRIHIATRAFLPAYWRNIKGSLKKISKPVKRGAGN